MKKILFLIQWYPSQLSANALLDEKIIQGLLRRQDCQITVLSYRYKESKKFEQNGRLTIKRFRRSFWWDIVTRAKKQGGKEASLVLTLNKLLNRINLILTFPVYPKVEVWATCKFRLYAYLECRRNNYDLVIAEHHGGDCLQAGLHVKKYFPEIKFIAILWDPLSAKALPKYLPREYTVSKLRRAEEELLCYADSVVALRASRERISDVMRGSDRFSKYKWLDIPGLCVPEYSGKEFVDEIIYENKLNIVFTGLLTIPDRDPTYIVHLLNSLDFAKDLNLVFIASGEGLDKLKHLSDVFNGSIITSPYLRPNQLLYVFERCDILLNFGGSNPSMVPSKIFEYMSHCKPIISTYFIDNDSSKYYLEKYPCAICIDQRINVEHHLDNLKIFFLEKVKIFVDYNVVKSLFAANTIDSYLHEIDRLLND